MNRTPQHSLARTAARRAVTLVEILVAIAVTGVFLAGVLEAFVYIVRSSEQAEVQLEAMTNARTAIDRMAAEIKTARIDPRVPIQFFHGTPQDLAYGDGMDNDNDDFVDEEIRNGRDDDGDWNASTSDRHVFLGAGWYERGDLLSIPDVGDAGVDEDCRFGRDILEFRTFPDPDNPGFREQSIRYEIASWDGQDNVLVRRVIYNPSDPSTTYVESDPLAFNCLSLKFLYWDPNRIPNGWVPAWDSYWAPFYPDPQIEIPAAVYIELTVYAGTEPFNTYQPGRQVMSITLETIANIEQVLKDERYQNLK